jgi:ABC-type glycerol-3-phosphate transport system substrate-binding protein
MLNFINFSLFIEKKQILLYDTNRIKRIERDIMDNVVQLVNISDIIPGNFKPSNEEKEKAACEFVEYFTNIENSSRWCRSIGAVSPYKDVQKQAEFADYLANNQVLQASIKTMEHGGTFPPVIGARAIRNEIKQAFAQVVGGLKTAKQALSEAEINSNKALQGK